MGSAGQAGAAPPWTHRRFWLTHVIQRGCIHDGHCVLRGTHEGQQAAVPTDCQGVGTWAGILAHHVSCQHHGGRLARWGGHAQSRHQPARGPGCQNAKTSRVPRTAGVFLGQEGPPSGHLACPVTVATGGADALWWVGPLLAWCSVLLLLGWGRHRPSLTFHFEELVCPKTTLARGV